MAQYRFRQLQRRGDRLTATELRKEAWKLDLTEDLSTRLDCIDSSVKSKSVESRLP